MRRALLIATINKGGPRATVSSDKCFRATVSVYNAGLDRFQTLFARLSPGAAGISQIDFRRASLITASRF